MADLGRGASMRTEQVPPSSLESVEAILRDPSTYRISTAIPQKARTGRPRAYPSFMYILFRDLISVFGSARQVEAELGHPEMWSFVCRLVKEIFPNDPSMWLPPDDPMRRYHYRYVKDKYLKDDQVDQAIRDASRREGVETARELGLLNPDGPGSTTHPDRSRLLYGDAKVIPSMYKPRAEDVGVDKRTGDTKQARYDPDAGFHIEGDGKEALRNETRPHLSSLGGLSGHPGYGQRPPARTRRRGGGGHRVPGTDRAARPWSPSLRLR
jgi:hypothetical protein